MRGIQSVLLSTLVFLWINFCVQFFTQTSWLVIFILVISFSLGIVFYKKYQSLEGLRLKHWYWSIPLLLPMLWQSYYLLYEKNGRIWTLNYSNLGDLPYHIGLANYLQTASFWPSNYIFSIEPLKYPFAIDYLHALLQNLLSYQVLYPLLTIVFLMLSVVLTIHMGGVGFLYLVFCTSSLPFLLTSQESSWKNFFLTIFIPQRGYLLGLPLGLLLLYIAHRYHFLKEKLSYTQVVVAGFFLGSLAWVHLHTYLFFALFLTSLWLRKRDRHFFLLLCIGAALGMPFVLQSTDFFQKASSFQWMPLWEKADAGNSIYYLLQNFGFFIPVLLASIWVKGKEAKYWLYSSGCFFIVFLFVQLSPWSWDNIKVIFWAYITFLYVIYQSLTKKWQRLVLVLLLSTLGLVKIYKETFIAPNPQVIASVQEIKKYEGWFLQAGSRDASYIIFPTYNHPVYFYGARVVMGYEGHLWSHGVSYQDLQSAMKKMATFTSLDWKAFAQKYNSRYLVFSQIEKSQFGSLLALESLDVAYTYEDLVIYKMY